jgi:hypothetical protein
MSLKPRFRSGPDHPLAGFLGRVRGQRHRNAVRTSSTMTVPCSALTSLGREWGRIPRDLALAPNNRRPALSVLLKRT